MADAFLKSGVLSVSVNGSASRDLLVVLCAHELLFLCPPHSRNPLAQWFSSGSSQRWSIFVAEIKELRLIEGRLRIVDGDTKRLVSLAPSVSGSSEDLRLWHQELRSLVELPRSAAAAFLCHSAKLTRLEDGDSGTEIWDWVEKLRHWGSKAAALGSRCQDVEREDAVLDWQHSLVVEDAFTVACILAARRPTVPDLPASFTRCSVPREWTWAAHLLGGKDVQRVAVDVFGGLVLLAAPRTLQPGSSMLRHHLDALQAVQELSLGCQDLLYADVEMAGRQVLSVMCPFTTGTDGSLVAALEKAGHGPYTSEQVALGSQVAAKLHLSEGASVFSHTLPPPVYTKEPKLRQRQSVALLSAPLLMPPDLPPYLCDPSEDAVAAMIVYADQERQPKLVELRPLPDMRPSMDDKTHARRRSSPGSFLRSALSMQDDAEAEECEEGDPRRRSDPSRSENGEEPSQQKEDQELPRKKQISACRDSGLAGAYLRVDSTDDSGEPSESQPGIEYSPRSTPLFEKLDSEVGRNGAASPNSGEVSFSVLQPLAALLECQTKDVRLIGVHASGLHAYGRADFNVFKETTSEACRPELNRLMSAFFARQVHGNIVITMPVLSRDKAETTASTEVLDDRKSVSTLSRLRQSVSASLSFSPSKDSIQSTKSSLRKQSLSPKFAVSTKEGTRRRLPNRCFQKRFRREFLEFLQRDSKEPNVGDATAPEALPALHEDENLHKLSYDNRRALVMASAFLRSEYCARFADRLHMAMCEDMNAEGYLRSCKCRRETAPLFICHSRQLCDFLHDAGINLRYMARIVRFVELRTAHHIENQGTAIFSLAEAEHGGTCSPSPENGKEDPPFLSLAQAKVIGDLVVAELIGRAAKHAMRWRCLSRRISVSLDAKTARSAGAVFRRESAALLNGIMLGLECDRRRLRDEADQTTSFFGGFSSSWSKHLESLEKVLDDVWDTITDKMETGSSKTSQRATGAPNSTETAYRREILWDAALFWQVESRAWILLGAHGEYSSFLSNPECQRLPSHLAGSRGLMPIQLLPAVLRQLRLTLGVRSIRHLQRTADFPIFHPDGRDFEICAHALPFTLRNQCTADSPDMGGAETDTDGLEPFGVFVRGERRRKALLRSKIESLYRKLQELPRKKLADDVNFPHNTGGLLLRKVLDGIKVPPGTEAPESGNSTSEDNFLDCIKTAALTQKILKPVYSCGVDFFSRWAAIDKETQLRCAGACGERWFHALEAWKSRGAESVWSSSVAWNMYLVGSTTLGFAAPFQLRAGVNGGDERSSPSAPAFELQEVPLLQETLVVAQSMRQSGDSTAAKSTAEAQDTASASATEEGSKTFSRGEHAHLASDGLAKACQLLERGEPGRGVFFDRQSLVALLLLQREMYAARGISKFTEMLVKSLISCHQVAAAASSDGLHLVPYGGNPVCSALLGGAIQAWKEQGAFAELADFFKAMLLTTTPPSMFDEHVPDCLVPAWPLWPLWQPESQRNETFGSALLFACKATSCGRSAFEWLTGGGIRGAECMSAEQLFHLYLPRGRLCAAGDAMGMNPEDAARAAAKFSLSQEAEESSTGQERPLEKLQVVSLPAGISAWKVSCGCRHSCFITTTGTLYSFGSGAAGRLGVGDELDRRHPVPIGGGLARKVVADVACGRDHTMCVTGNGVVFGWGWGEVGRLGLGDAGAVLLPQPTMLSLPDDADGDTNGDCTRAISVATGREHSLALTADGRVFSTGAGDLGQLGLGIEQEVALRFTLIRNCDLDHEKVTSIAAGEAHSVAGTASGAVYSWGFGQSGALGHGDVDDRELPTQVDLHLEGHSDNVEIDVVAAGAYHTCALSRDGRVLVWGDGASGQLGVEAHSTALDPAFEEEKRIHRPIEVSLHERRAVGIACGSYTCATITESSQNNEANLYSWGWPLGGEGVDPPVPAQTPSRCRFDAVPERGALNICDMDCGGYHLAAVAGPQITGFRLFGTQTLRGSRNKAFFKSLGEQDLAEEDLERLQSLGVRNLTRLRFAWWMMRPGGNGCGGRLGVTLDMRQPISGSTVGAGWGAMTLDWRTRVSMQRVVVDTDDTTDVSDSEEDETLAASGLESRSVGQSTDYSSDADLDHAFMAEQSSMPWHGEPDLTAACGKHKLCKHCRHIYWSASGNTTMCQNCRQLDLPPEPSRRYRGYGWRTRKT